MFPYNQQSDHRLGLSGILDLHKWALTTHQNHELREGMCVDVRSFVCTNLRCNWPCLHSSTEEERSQNDLIHLIVREQHRFIAERGGPTDPKTCQNLDSTSWGCRAVWDGRPEGLGGVSGDPNVL